MTRPAGSHRVSWTEFTNTFVPFGVLLSAALLAAESTLSLDRYRALYVLWATTALAAPGFAFAVLAGRSPTRGRYAFLFWGFAWLAFLVHLGYAASLPPYQRAMLGQPAFWWLGWGLAGWWAVDLVLAWLRAGAAWVTLQRGAARLGAVAWLAYLTLSYQGSERLGHYLGLALLVTAAVSLVAAWRLAPQLSVAPLGPAPSEPPAAVPVSDLPYGKPLPPGSFGLPLVGETLALARDPHRFFRRRVAKHGRVFKTCLFGEPVVVFSGPEAFTFFLDPRYFTRRDATPRPIRELLARHALPFLGEEGHARRKRLVLQAFRPEALDRYLPAVEQAAAVYLAHWEQVGEFIWLPEYQRYSATLTSALFTGPRAAEVEEEVGRSLGDFLKGFGAVPVNLPWTTYGRALRTRDRLLGVIDAAIAHHRKQASPDLLSELIRARDVDGSGLSEDELRRETLHLLFAAYSGIYVCLTLLSLALARYEPARERARAEVRQALPAGPLQLDRLHQLAYLDRLVREVRRFYPINANTFFARVKRACSFQGLHVPEGWTAVGAIHTTLHDPQAFTDPERFDPDRFEPEREARLPANSYVPHGGGPPEGPRCAGEALITALLKAVAVLLLRDYAWELPPQDLSFNRAQFPVPNSGLRVRFRRCSQPQETR
jgi:cytochrome P450